MNKDLADKITDILRAHCYQINAEIGMLTDEKVGLSVLLDVNKIVERKDGNPNYNMYYSFFGEREGGGPRLIDEHKFYHDDLGGFRSGRF